MLGEVKLRNLKPKDKPYKVADADGLYVLVTPAGGKLWRLDYRFEGKRKTLALGAYPEVILRDARMRALEAKKLLAQGIDPSQKRRAEREARQDTFENVAREWIDKMGSSWAPGHLEKVRSRLKKWVLPVLGAIPVARMTAPQILECAQRAASEGKVETAHRVIQVVGQVIRYAVATEKAQADPTPSLRGALPRAPERHYPAVTELEALAEILQGIWNYEGGPVVRSALKVLVYTFQRPREVRHMKWEQIDFGAAQWRFVVPKTKQEHMVPLATQMVEILKNLGSSTVGTRWVFPRIRWDRPISNMTLNRALQTMGFDTKSEITSHGFRTVARTLLHEKLGFPAEVIGHQLAHKVPDPLGTAYNRTRFLEQRVKMMQAWADYLDGLVADHGLYPEQQRHVRAGAHNPELVP